MPKLGIRPQSFTPLGDSAKQSVPPLKSLIVVATLWDFGIALFGMIYAPPFATAMSIFSPPSYLMRFFYPFEGMYFHALAIPFIAVLVYATLVVFRARGKAVWFTAISATASFPISSLAALYVVLTGASRFAYDILWAGLGLGALAALGLLVTTWPKRDWGQATMNLSGRNLASLCVWISVIGVLSAAAVGVYASFGSSMWGAASSFTGSALAAATHEHAMITMIDASLVALIVKEFKADLYYGIPGLFVKIGLYGTLLGIPTVAVATYATMPMGVVAHNAIIGFAAILLQAALFVTYAIIYTEAKNLKTGFVAGIARNMMMFGLLFILFWVNVVVTLPGIYVAFNLSSFAGGPNEQAFITGHTHALIILTALTLLMLIAHSFGSRGKLSTLGGFTLTLGYLVSTGATVLYIFYDWNPTTSVYIPYIGAGIVLILVGIASTLTAIGISKFNPFVKPVETVRPSSVEPEGGE